MSIFGSITEKLFGKAQPAPTASDVLQNAVNTAMASATGDVSAAAAATPTASDVLKNAIETASAAVDAAAATQPAAFASVASASAADVDVAAIMEAAVQKSGQKLDWRNSIVDMMKALDLDSSLTARKELADELHYTGDKGDSAAMNIWLHKALMKALAANGGKVPAELLA